MPHDITSDCNRCGTCILGCDSGAIKEGPDRSRIDVAV
jgi:ferredoxin